MTYSNNRFELLVLEISISQADSSSDWAELDESESGQDVDTTTSELATDSEASIKEQGLEPTEL